MKTTLKQSLSLLAVSLMMVSCADVVDSSMENQEGLDKNALEARAPIEGFVKCPVEFIETSSNGMQGTIVEKSLIVDGMDYATENTALDGQFHSSSKQYKVDQVVSYAWPFNDGLFVCEYYGSEFMSIRGYSIGTYSERRSVRRMLIKLPENCEAITDSNPNMVGFMCPEVSDELQEQKEVPSKLGSEPLR